jgi:hypothetical protein
LFFGNHWISKGKAGSFSPRLPFVADLSDYLEGIAICGDQMSVPQILASAIRRAAFLYLP